MRKYAHDKSMAKSNKTLVKLDTVPYVPDIKWYETQAIDDEFQDKDNSSVNERVLHTEKNIVEKRALKSQKSVKMLPRSTEKTESRSQKVILKNFEKIRNTDFDEFVEKDNKATKIKGGKRGRTEYLHEALLDPQVCNSLDFDNVHLQKKQKKNTKIFLEGSHHNLRLFASTEKKERNQMFVEQKKNNANVEEESNNVSPMKEQKNNHRILATGTKAKTKPAALHKANAVKPANNDIALNQDNSNVHLNEHLEPVIEFLREEWLIFKPIEEINAKFFETRSNAVNIGNSALKSGDHIGSSPIKEQKQKDADSNVSKDDYKAMRKRNTNSHKQVHGVKKMLLKKKKF